MKTKTRQLAFLALLVLMAACGPTLDGDEPTGLELQEATNGIAGLPNTHCADGSQGVITTLRAGVNVPGSSSWIEQANPLGNHQGATSCYADGDTGGGNDRSCLIRWEVALGIPTGKLVLNAWLEVFIVDPSPEWYPVQALRRPWQPTEVTWLAAGATNPWQVAGARGSQDREAFFFTRVPGGVPAGWQVLPLASVGGVLKVQQWVNDPSTNHGIIIADEFNPHAVRIRSSEYAGPLERPGLRVQYCP